MIDIAYWAVVAAANIATLWGFLRWRRDHRQAQGTLRWTARASMVLVIIGIVGRATETLGILGDSFDPSQRALILFPAWPWYLVVLASGVVPFVISRIVSKRSKQHGMPTFALRDQLHALQTYLGRDLPGSVYELFLPGSATANRLLPLATGREHDVVDPAASPEARYADAQARLESVLGHAIGNAELSRVDPDHVWPHGLLVVEDFGCSIYRAVDLDDPRLRVIEYEHLAPADEPQVAAGSEARLAYGEPHVHRSIQHRFVVIADSLDDWLRKFPSP